MPSPRVFLSGFFGFHNLGDEAILEAVVKECRRRVPGVTITASFGPDRATAERLGIAPIDFFSLDATATAVEGSQLVLFGLGGVFHDYWGAQAASLFREGTNGVEAYTRPALLAAMAGVPAVLFCGGVGPLRTRAARAMFRMACEAATLLLVRDATSADETRAILPRAAPVIVADPAHLCTASDEDRHCAARLLADSGIGRGAIAVAVRAWDFFEAQEALATRLSAALARLPAEWPIVFVPCHRGSGADDVAFAEAVRSRLPKRLTANVEVATAGEAVALFERMAVVVAARNHGVVLAGCAGVPAVALSYDPKVSASAEALGLGPLVLQLDEMHRLPAAIARIKDEPEKWIPAVDANRRRLASHLGEAFLAVEHLLAGEQRIRIAGVEASPPPRDEIGRVLPRLRQRLRALRTRVGGL